MTPAPASRPRLLVVAGPNGAGKTTITERGLAHEWFHGCEYINPDAIAQDELGDWNDAETVLRAAKLATERRETCLNERRSLAFETVFSATDKPDFVRRALGASVDDRSALLVASAPGADPERGPYNEWLARTILPTTPALRAGSSASGVGRRVASPRGTVR